MLAGQASRQGYQVLAQTHRDLDITDADAVSGVIQGNDLVVNCAAVTNVDACEDHPETAHAVNAVGPRNLARTCAAVGARLIHLSTDYVFSGDLRRPYEISDPTGPLSVYGHSKLDGEHAVHAELPEAHVVRTSWVYTGGAGTDFVAAMRRLAATTDGTIDLVADQTSSPTYAADLVGALLQIAAGGIDGPILHAANAGQASRYEQAREVFALEGADPDRVRPVNAEQSPRPARRPVYSALSMTESARAGLTPLRPWRDALRAALAVPTDRGPIASAT